MTWLLAGLNIGVAMGAAVAGQVVDLGWSGFGVAVVAGALGLKWVKTRPQRVPPGAIVSLLP